MVGLEAGKLMRREGRAGPSVKSPIPSPLGHGGQGLLSTEPSAPWGPRGRVLTGIMLARKR